MGTATDEIDRRQAEHVDSLITTAERAVRNAIREAQKHPLGDNVEAVLKIAMQAIETAGDLCQEGMIK